MNACANCHATGRADVFKLARAFDAGNRRSAQQNLTAVLGQVNLERPQSSPLLQKAASAHGGMAQPAFQGRQAAAYHTLEDWVRQVSGKSLGTPKEAQTVAVAP